MSESAEAASSLSEGTDNSPGLHLLSPDWCTLFRVSYATQPRYCRNYALKIYDTRRNRRNSPSMARFLLASASMPRHFCALQHNSTDTKQLRYSPTRQHRLPPPPASATYAEIIIVPFLTCGSFGTALATFMWEAHILRRFPLDTLNLPEGMQCVLKKIMNCREVPYSLITKMPRHIHNLSVHGLGADFIIF